MSGTNGTELWQLGAAELAETIRTRQASSREVIEAHLRRIDAVNPSINAIVVPIGRTNMPSGAIRWHCESELWGATLNSIPGGSSSSTM